MTDPGAPISALPPSPSRECRSAAGYEACFYPGFVRRLVVHGEDGTETVLYDQNYPETKKPFVLPAGQLKPWPSSTLEVRGNGTRIMLMVDDPNHEIDRVEVVLKPREPGGRPVRIIAEDDPVLCPPICPE